MQLFQYENYFNTFCNVIFTFSELWNKTKKNISNTFVQTTNQILQSHHYQLQVKQYTKMSV